MSETRAELGSTEAGAAGALAEVSVEQLGEENARLRARVAELEAMLARRAAESEGGAGGEAVSRHQLLTLINSAPNIIFLKDTSHRFVLVNPAFAAGLGKKPEDFIGLTVADVFPPEIAAMLRAEEAEILASGRTIDHEEELPTPQGMRWVHTVKFPTYDADRRCLGIGALITDITDSKREDTERLMLREQVIAAQEAMLRERSTPLLPLADGVLAMPLIGTVDSARAGEILETLLRGIAERGAHTAILDVTGVRAVDIQTADALVGAARAARLLGARVVVTGVTPAVAMTLVQLQADLDGFTIFGTLASGIAFALR